ncbi:DMT family transporter [Pseudooceanicola marinus]|uniref:DMT family transporter n=1 Tax=Pseudooceanicola marinus TaxID=396013 RepID=UPI001CD35DFB|nr:DMT family transporter [Pseudooceanicola marinus]MCA1335681.1 DMT family transporter [Pseudooceanicola marinus]
MSTNLRGSLFMVLAMIGFAIEDAIFKGIVTTLPPGFTTLLFGLIGTLLFSGLCWQAGEPALTRDALRPRLLIRSAIELVGRLFFALALAFTPLSSTSAILQAAPLFVTLGAAVLLGERVGPRRWIAMAFGFLGVLLILKPTPAAFEPQSVFALLGMIGFAGRDLATRMAPPAVSGRQLGTLGFLVITCAGLVFMIFDTAPPRLPEAGEGARVLALGLVGVSAYTALTVAMRSGEVSVVAPFRYSRLLIALLIAYLFFGERPDLWTLAGGLLIVVSGTYTLMRSGRGAVPPAPEGP